MTYRSNTEGTAMLSYTYLTKLTRCFYWVAFTLKRMMNDVNELNEVSFRLIHLIQVIHHSFEGMSGLIKTSGLLHQISAKPISRRASVGERHG
jgi:hypothetical protein